MRVGSKDFMPQKILKLIFLILALFHVLVGFGLALSTDFQVFAVELYGAKLVWTGQSHYLLRVVGSFAFALGLVMFQIAQNPLKNTCLIFCVLGFFVFRNIQRMIFVDEIKNLQISEFANMLTNVGFLGLIVGVFILVLFVNKRSS